MKDLPLSAWHNRALRLVASLTTAAACLGASGCVTRRLTIVTNPPGALVYVDDIEVGTTPVSFSYLYYGTREIRIVKDGYETMTVLEPIPAPWWDHFPLDFVSENLIPGDLRDDRVLTYQLVPQINVPPQELLARAEELRRSGRGVEVAPVPTVAAPALGAPAVRPGAVPASGALPPGQMVPATSPPVQYLMPGQ